MGYWTRLLSEGRLQVAGEAAYNRTLFKVFTEIAEHVRTFKEVGDYSQSAFRGWSLSKFLETRGYNIAFNNCADLGPGYPDIPFAGVNPPTLDKNNPLIVNFRRHQYQGNSDLEVFSRYVKENYLQGEVGTDLTLAGDITKIPVTVYLSRALMEMCDAEEVAAVILHELGHVYFYFRFLMRSLVSNGVADNLANNFMKTEDKTIRLKLIRDAEKITGTRINNQENLVEEYRKEVIYTHVVNDLMLVRESIVGGEAMSNRTWERLADHYVGLHGASSYLATGMYKQEKSMGLLLQHRAYDSFAARWMFDTIVTATLVLSNLALGGFAGIAFEAAIVALGLHLNDPDDTLYDEPVERYNSMRRALVAQLKDIEGGSGAEVLEARRRTLAAIATIDELLTHVNENENIFTFVQKNWMPKGRKSQAVVKYQHDLESYLVNDLTVISSKLKDKIK